MKHVGATSLFPSTPWFRGVPCAEYKLLPSLMRNGPTLERVPDVERNVMSYFMNKSEGFAPERSDSGWHYLFLMQYYGTPTRLLDWTDSLSVALFFAVNAFRGTSASTHPVLWVLNPFKLNRKSVGKTIVFDKSDPIEYDYYSTIKDGRPFPHEFPIAVQPAWFDTRMRSQRGCFTVHGSDLRPIEEQGDKLNNKEKFVESVHIPPNLVRPLRRFLSLHKVDEFHIFQDLDSLSKSLMREFRLHN